MMRPEFSRPGTNSYFMRVLNWLFTPKGVHRWSLKPTYGIRARNVRGFQAGAGNLQINRYEYQVDQPIIDFATVLSCAAVRDALKALSNDPNNSHLQRKANRVLAFGPLLRKRPNLGVKRSKVSSEQRANVIGAFIFVENSEGVQIGNHTTQRNQFIYLVVPTVNAAQLLADDPAVRSAVIDFLCSPDEAVAGDVLRDELSAALESAVLGSPDVRTEGDLIHFSGHGRLDVNGGDGVAISIEKKGRQRNEARAVVAAPDTVVKSLREKRIGQPADLPPEDQVEIPSADQADIQPTSEVGIQPSNREQAPSLTGRHRYSRDLVGYPVRGDNSLNPLVVKRRGNSPNILHPALDDYLIQPSDRTHPGISRGPKL